MNIRSLQYLVAIADHKHFGKAAAACFVSQPTLSMQIKKLERWFEVQLVERTNKSVRLTAVGEEIAARARHICQDVEQLKTFAQSTKNPLAGDCRLGMIHTLAPYITPYFLPKLQKCCPELSTYLIEATTDELIEQLLKGECDAIMLALPVNNPHIDFLPLFTEDFYLAVAKNHPLAKRKRVTIEDIDNTQILLLKEGHCLRDQALEFCQQIDAVQHEFFKATSLETLRQMVASNLGVTFVPALAMRQDKSKQIAYIPFQKPLPHRVIGLCWRKTNARQALFIKMGETVNAAIDFEGTNRCD